MSRMLLWSLLAVAALAGVVVALALAPKIAVLVIVAVGVLALIIRLALWIRLRGSAEGRGDARGEGIERGEQMQTFSATRLATRVPDPEGFGPESATHFATQMPVTWGSRRVPLGSRGILVPLVGR